MEWFPLDDSFEHLKVVTPITMLLMKTYCQPPAIAPTPSSASAYVAQLAHEHAVVYRRTAWENYAVTITQLAGDDVRLDATQKLIVALAKADVIDGTELVHLMHRHWNETYGL